MGNSIFVTYHSLYENKIEFKQSIFSAATYRTKTSYKTGTFGILINFLHKMNSDFNALKLIYNI
jgi:hypothetical protein